MHIARQGRTRNGQHGGLLFGGLDKGDAEIAPHLFSKCIPGLYGSEPDILIVIDNTAVRHKRVFPVIDLEGLRRHHRGRHLRPLKPVLSRQHDAIGLQLLRVQSLDRHCRGTRSQCTHLFVSYRLLLKLHNGTGMDVHIELGRDNVLRIVIPNGRLMHMDGLNRLAGIADEEAHTKHVSCESIVTSGRSELVVEGLEVPGAALHTVRQTDPGVLGIGSGPEEPQRFILLLIVSKERKELVGHVDRVYVFQGIVAEDIGIRIDDNGIRGHLLIGILQQIGIGEPFPNDLLLNFVGVFTAAPFVSEILFVQENHLVDQWIGQIVLEALTNLLLAFCHTVYKVLRNEPDLGRLRIGITDTDAVGCELC